MRKSAVVSTLMMLQVFLAATMAGAFTTFSENWEGYTNGATPYDSWELQAGTWGSISSPGLASPQCYSVAQGQTSRIRKVVNLDSITHIVLQGWFNDSGVMNSSMLGLAGDNTADDNSMIRMGANNAANYQVQYFDGLAGGLNTVDTGLAVEAGWHFARLDIVDVGAFGLSTVTYRVWNAAKTVEKKGEFPWFFTRVDSNWVTLGSPGAASATVKWDDINFGSLADVGEAPLIIPEPGSLLALASGLMGLTALLRRRRR